MSLWSGSSSRLVFRSSPSPHAWSWIVWRHVFTLAWHLWWLGSCGGVLASIWAMNAHLPDTGSTSSGEMSTPVHASRTNWQVCFFTCSSVISSPVPERSADPLCWSNFVITMTSRLPWNTPVNKNKQKMNDLWFFAIISLNLRWVKACMYNYIIMRCNRLQKCAWYWSVEYTSPSSFGVRQWYVALVSATWSTGYQQTLSSSFLPTMKGFSVLERTGFVRFVCYGCENCQVNSKINSSV